MKGFLAGSRPFPWRKMGRVYAPPEGEFSHGSHPCAVHVEGDRFVVAITRRDSRQRSQIFLSYATVADGRVVLEGEPRLALRHGEPGYFDCDGVISVCFVKCEGRIYLYYVGWQNLPDTLWICDTGRAILDPAALELTREFPGPCLAATGTTRCSPRRRRFTFPRQVADLVQLRHQVGKSRRRLEAPLRNPLRRVGRWN